MIDLADPNTDVIALYREFKCQRPAQTRFWKSEIVEWIYYHKSDGEHFQSGGGPHTYKTCCMLSHQLFCIWLKLGYIQSNSFKDGYPNYTFIEPSI